MTPKIAVIKESATEKKEKEEKKGGWSKAEKKMAEPGSGEGGDKAQQVAWREQLKWLEENRDATR